MIEITPELAEIIGIYVGDGYLRYEGRRKELDISGSYEEKVYYDNHVIPLFNQEFNLSIKGRFFPSRRTYGFVIRDRFVINKFKEFGFPSGKKSLSVTIPQFILSSKNSEVKPRFIRGLFDTDGCLSFINRSGYKTYSEFKRTYNYYPTITINSISKKLIISLIKLLEDFDFTYHTAKYTYKEKNWNTKYTIFLSGIFNLSNWIDKINIKNPVKMSRYLVWKKFGFCPTNIDYNQRINILKGKLNPYLFYKGVYSLMDKTSSFGSQKKLEVLGSNPSRPFLEN